MNRPLAPETDPMCLFSVLADEEALPEEAVGAVAIVLRSIEFGVQFAIAWTDPDGIRRTIMIQGTDLREFAMLSDALAKTVKAAKRGKTTTGTRTLAATSSPPLKREDLS